MRESSINLKSPSISSPMKFATTKKNLIRTSMLTVDTVMESHFDVYSDDSYKSPLIRQFKMYLEEQQKEDSEQLESEKLKFFKKLFKLETM